MEHDIAFLANVIGESSTVARFTEASQNRQKAMNRILWNTEMGQWLDYWLGNSNTSEVGMSCMNSCRCLLTLKT